MTAEAHPPVISVMLAVPDAAAAARWYAQALGATRIRIWQRGYLSVAGALFFLGEPENNGWDHPAALGSRTVRIEVFVDDPDAFIDRAVRLEPTAASTRSATMKHPGACTGRAASSTRSATCWLVGDRSPLQAS